MQTRAHGCFEIHLRGNLEKMCGLNASGKEDRINVSLDKRVDSRAQRSKILRQGPLVDRHASDVCASFSKAVKQFRIRDAVFLDGDSGAIQTDSGC